MAPTGKVPASTVTSVTDRVSPTKAFINPSNNSTSTNRKSALQNSKTAKRHPSGRRGWRGVRRGVGQRKKPVKSGVGHRSIRVDVQNVTSVKNLNYTAVQGSVKNKLNLTMFAYGRKHPCNSVNTTAIKFKTGNIECRRLETSDLQQQMNCRGTYNHKYLAASFEEALKFKDLDTGKTMDLKDSFVLHRSSSRRQKKGLDIDPGETLVVQCHATKTPTESGHLRICPSCSAITRQPSTPRRFPEYINELLCDPQMVSGYLPGIDAFCVQKTFTLDLLQSTDEWELNSVLSAEAGYDVYTEKWEVYTQTIRRHCACELLPSSPMAMYL